MICSEEEQFFKSKNIQINKNVVLKSDTESMPGSLSVVANHGAFGLGLGGNLHNEKDQVVGDYSDTKLVYSTKKGKYDQLVDDFEFEMDYTDKNNVQIKIKTPNNKYDMTTF